MYRFLRYASVVTLLLMLSSSCETTSEMDKYILVVFSEDGSPIENAMVTPQIIGKNFETKYTGVDGQVDLRGLYSQMPTSIVIRATRYKSKSVKWNLPSPIAQTVVLEKF